MGKRRMSPPISDYEPKHLERMGGTTDLDSALHMASSGSQQMTNSIISIHRPVRCPGQRYFPSPARPSPRPSKTNQNPYSKPLHPTRRICIQFSSRTASAAVAGPFGGVAVEFPLRKTAG